MKNINRLQNLCFCGCGQVVRTGQFCRGHAAKLRSVIFGIALDGEYAAQKITHLGWDFELRLARSRRVQKEDKVLGRYKVPSTCPSPTTAPPPAAEVSTPPQVIPPFSAKTRP